VPKILVILSQDGTAIKSLAAVRRLAYPLDDWFLPARTLTGARRRVACRCAARCAHRQGVLDVRPHGRRIPHIAARDDDDAHEACAAEIVDNGYSGESVLAC